MLATSPFFLVLSLLLFFSLLVYFSRNIMIFASLALLSGMILSASAAPWYSPPAPVTQYAPITHYVNVSNDTAGLLYDPPYVVSQPSSQLYIDSCAHMFFSSDRRDWRHHRVQVPYQEPHGDPVQLWSSMHSS